MRERSATLGLAASLPGIVLVVVIVWALAAVLMLTGTLVNAREIDNTLPLIKAQVFPIDEELDNVKLAEETARLTERIRIAAAPLSEQADRIIVEARKIDRNAASILVTARAINGTAEAINGNALAINDNALAINDTVSAISGNVVSINQTVNSIGGSVFSINGRVSRVGGNVATINRRVTRVLRAVGPAGATEGGSIKASVDSILGTFQALDPETRSIDAGVAAINRRGDRGIEGSALLKSDFGPIREFVGPGELGAAGHSTDGRGAIHGHANSIDCSALINFFGDTQYCGR